MSLRNMLLALFRRGVPASPRPDYKPHPMNVPGPVYVADGCCMSCGVWELDAPEHFSWQDEPHSHCFISHQPQTDEQFERIAAAMHSQELDCIRVRDCNDRWRAILIERGLGEYIDD